MLENIISDHGNLLTYLQGYMSMKLVSHLFLIMNGNPVLWYILGISQKLPHQYETKSKMVY